MGNAPASTKNPLSDESKVESSESSQKAAPSYC